MIITPIALIAFLFLLIAVARFCEHHFSVVKKITSAGLCTVIGIAFANVGVIPHQSVVYEGIFEYGVTYAIVLMVLCSRFDVLRNAGRPLVIAYVLAVLGSFSGALIASSLCYELSLIHI